MERGIEIKPKLNEPTEGYLVILSCHEINRTSQKYLIGHSYKNDEFDWQLDLVTVT